MKRFRRIATLMLAIIMAASTAVIPSYAESNIQYSESDLHELIDYDMAVDAGHVNRLNDEEDLNTLIFANEDNTKTMYFYGEDIKYTDEFGIVRDKTNKLTSTATGYTNADNDISIHLPNMLSDGITIDYEDISLMLVPAASELPDHIEADDVAVPRGEADYVVYDDVFGAKTSLKYTPMYSGLKEDIILDEYTGVSEFQFLLYTGGLELDEVDNEYVLLDGEDTVAKLSQVFIYDSEYNTAVGSMIITPIKDDQIYAITVCADVDFLTASSTVYPVTVDPSITIPSVNGSTKQAYDATLSKVNQTTSYGTSQTLTLGGDLQGYIAMSFWGLNNSSTFTSLFDLQITNASLHMYCVSKGISAKVNVNNYNPSGSWSDSGITYSNSGISYDSSVSHSATISSTSNVSVPITNLVKEWASNHSLISKGLLLRLDSGNYNYPSYYYNFYSSEATSATLRPFLSITYNEDGIYRIKNVYSEKYMTVDQGINSVPNNYPNSSNPLIGVNIYQSGLKTNEEDINQGLQYFRIVYDSSSNTHKIRPMSCMNGYKRTIQASGLSDNENVIVNTPSGNGNTAYDKLTFKRAGDYYSFLFADNNSLAISVVDSSNGSGITESNVTTGDLSCRTATANGNVFVDTYSSSSTKQKWQLEYIGFGEENFYYNMGFDYPIDLDSSPNSIKINSDYGKRIMKDSNGDFEINDHEGIDIYAERYEEVYTPFKGDVVYTRNEATDGRGRFVVIKCTEPGVYKYSNSQKSIYVVLMHLQSIPASLPTSVERGTIVGYVGDSGVEGSVHLHMEFLYLTGDDSRNQYYSYLNNTIDPLKFYNDQLIEFD